MIIRQFTQKDLPQILQLCREIRQYHIDILGGYFTEQDDTLEQIGFIQSLHDDKTIGSSLSMTYYAKGDLDDFRENICFNAPMHDCAKFLSTILVMPYYIPITFNI